MVAPNLVDMRCCPNCRATFNRWARYEEHCGEEAAMFLAPEDYPDVQRAEIEQHLTFCSDECMVDHALKYPQTAENRKRQRLAAKVLRFAASYGAPK